MEKQFRSGGRFMIFFANNRSIWPVALLLFCLSLNGGEQPWYERALAGMEIVPTGAQCGGDVKDLEYASEFRGDVIVNAAVKAHAEYVVMWARDGEFAYYDSKHQPKPPGFGARDCLRETMDAARGHGMPVIAYCVLQYPSSTLRAHPDWRIIKSDGEPINHLVCFNSPYKDFVKLLLDEMLEYGIDGFHLDMVDQGFGQPVGCWCEFCKEKYQQRYGHDMPEGVDWSPAWDDMLDFRYSTSLEFEHELTEHVRTRRPGVSVDFNYHGNPPFSWEVGQMPVPHARRGDFVTGETGVWGFSALTVGFNAEWYRAATPDKPYQVAMQRGVRMYHDQTTRPLHDMRWEMFNLLAHGAFVTMIDKTAFDGTLDAVAYDRMGRVLKESREKREHFGQAPVRQVGLYVSTRTRDWYARNDPPRYYQSLQGAHKALVYAHVPWEFVFDQTLTFEGLIDLPVLLVPNAAILSEREIRIFKTYVEQGGRLILTGVSGWHDHMGEIEPQTAIESLIGAKMKQVMPTTDNWVRLSETKASRDAVLDAVLLNIVQSKHDDDRVHSDRGLNGTLGRNFNPKQLIPSHQGEPWPFLVRGPGVVYEPTTAVSVGEIMKPHRSILHDQGGYNPDWPLSADQAVGPAVLIHALGKGVVYTMAASPGFAAGGEHHIPEARSLIDRAIRFLDPNPRISIEAPAHVETVITDDPDEKILRVHFLGYNAPPQTTPAKNRPYVLPSMMEDPPIFRATIHTRDRIRKARAWNENTKIKQRSRKVEVQVEDIHEVIQLHYR
jgi:hypothetical protein